MTKTKRKKYIKFVSSNWVITLTSTMIGVILGLYLNGYYENKSLAEDKKKAITQVFTEISENKKSLKNYHDLIIKNYNQINYIFSKLNNDFEIIVHKDSTNLFISKTKALFTFAKSEKINSNFAKIRGDLNFNVDSPLMISSLSQITWQAYKQTNFLAITNFKCLKHIEIIYELQKEVNELNKLWVKKVLNGEFTQDIIIRNKFMSDWRSLLLRQSVLLKAYKMNDDILKNCN
ncbi:hypothetical protein [Polaribacter sp.]|uniref:hypothetical protein n=1 Tax=Polaribacter sp. TaxID=1920175 RepID=UPI003F69EDE2